MKLLLDENLSRRLVPFLQDAYPGSSQVVLLGLERADDIRIWDYAAAQGYVLVSQDADFQERSALLGAPPKLIWLRLGNLSKAAVLQVLLAQRERIAQSLLVDGKDCVELL